MEKNGESLSSLEVIGYGDCIPREMAPAVVPPVFCRKDGMVIVPPYKYQGGMIVNATVVPYLDACAMADAGKIVLLEKPFKANEGFEMWVDGDLDAHYEPSEIVRRIFIGFSMAEKAVAIKAFNVGNFAGAEKHCHQARIANDRDGELIDLAEKIALAQGNTARAERMRDIRKGITG